MQKKKILFVCLGNICRSPMMEFLFRDEAARRGVGDMYEVESAGTSGEEAGNPVYPPARRELAKHGISCEGKRARKLTKNDYARFDLIVTAESRNSSDAMRFFGGDPDKKIMRLLDFSSAPRDIDDPWWTDDFDKAYADILEGVTALLDCDEKRR